MQYILTEEELKLLGPKKHYNKLIESVEKISETLTKNLCFRKDDKNKECEGCLLLDLWYDAKHSRVRLCLLPFGRR